MIERIHHWFYVRTRLNRKSLVIWKYDFIILRLWIIKWKLKAKIRYYDWRYPE